jgi:hypothetical protein
VPLVRDASFGSGFCPRDPVVVFVAAAVGRGSREINQEKGSSMRLLTRRKTPIEELKDAAIRALVNALDDDDKRAAKPGTNGVRALAAGALIYTAGRAAFKGQRFVREQLSSDTEDDQAQDLEDEEETRAYEEPEGEEYEVDEEEDEAEAVEKDDEPEAVEDDEEPEAYEEDDAPDEDEGTGDDEPDEGDRGPSGDEQEEPQSDEDPEEPEARREPDDESSSKTPTPLPERKPMRRAARRKGAQPSLKLPTQRRARTWASKD